MKSKEIISQNDKKNREYNTFIYYIMYIKVTTKCVLAYSYNRIAQNSF